MKTNRKTAIVVGVLFVIGTIAGGLSGILTKPILGVPDFMENLCANESRWLLGTILIMVMGFPLAMVPVFMYPIFKKQNEVLRRGKN